MARGEHERASLRDREGVAEGARKPVSDQYSGLGQATEGAGDAVVHDARVEVGLTVRVDSANYSGTCSTKSPMAQPK